VTVLLFRPVSGVTLAIGAMELVLLIVAVLLWMLRRPL
jgi:hypothetical protein